MLFLLTRHRYYRYSKEQYVVSPAKLCCHTVNRHGPRYRSYCLLLLSHVDEDKDDLREQAAKYGLEGEPDTLIQYLEAHGQVDNDRLLKWNGL